MKNSLCCGLKIINLHPKLSPSALWAPQPKHKHTTATMLLLLQLPPRLSYTHTHKRARTHTHRPVHTFTQSLSHSSSAVLCFLHPSGSRCCEGGRRGKGREGTEGRGAGPDHPALMAGLSVYIAVAHSVIHLAFWGHSLQPGMEELWRGGVVGRGCLGKERNLSGRKRDRGRGREGEKAREWKRERGVGVGNSPHGLLWSVIRRALVFE